MSNHTDGGGAALAPLYRVLRKRLAAVPYLGANAGRLVVRARRQADGALDEGLAELQAALADLDTLDVSERADAIGRIRGKLKQLKQLKRAGRPASARRGRRKRDAGSSSVVEAPALDWSTSLAEPALGVQVHEAAARHGLTTAAHLLWRPPSQVRVYAPVLGAGSAEAEGEVALGGVVVARWTRLSPGGGAVTTLRLRGSGDVCVVLRDPADTASLDAMAPLDGRVVFGGTLRLSGGSSMDAVLEGAEPVVPGRGRASAIHSGLAADETRLAPLRERMLDGDRFSFINAVPGAVCRRLGLDEQQAALDAVHRRGTDLDAARQRLALDEQIVAQLPASLRRFQVQRGRAASHTLSHRSESQLVADGCLDPLTASQREAFDDVKRDLLARNTMQRVLCGAPDAEPEAVALRAVLGVASSKAQVLVVTSEPSSAMWLHQLWEPALRAAGLDALLLDSEPLRSDVERLRKGEISVVFGAPSVLASGLEWRRLGMILAVEQGDYGALFARAIGYRAGAHPVDVLGLCRVPLPWATLKPAYPAADVSVVRASDDPPASGRVWTDPLRESAFRALGEQVQAGRQGLVMLPLGRSGADLVDVRDAIAIGQTMQEQFFPGATVGVLHGAQSVGERQRVLAGFLRRQFDLLVATTTLELHPRLPRGVVALLELADGFDVERLLAVRALVGPEGEVHYVLRTSPSPRSEQIIRALAEQVPSERIANDIADAFAGAAGVVGNPAPALDDALSWTGLVLRDAPIEAIRLLTEARALVHQALRTDAALRHPAHAELLRLAHALWPVVHGETCPLPSPPKREDAPSRRRRRRRGR